MVIKLQQEQTTKHQQVTTQRPILQGKPKLYDDLDRIDACESFRGSENPIHREKTMVAEFICGFGEIMRNYPFGKETCSFKFFIRGSDNQLTNLTIGSLKNLAEVRKEFIE